MSYATVADVQARMTRELSADEQTVCATLLDDAATLIDSYNSTAGDAAKTLVSCRMVVRALGDGSSDVPYGATQGSTSALGYSQSWTIGAGGGVGEVYISKVEKRLLGVGNALACHSPVEALVRGTES